MRQTIMDVSREAPDATTKPKRYDLANMFVWLRCLCQPVSRIAPNMFVLSKSCARRNWCSDATLVLGVCLSLQRYANVVPYFCYILQMSHSLRAKIMDLRGPDSSRILSSRDGTPRPTGNFEQFPDHPNPQPRKVI